MVVLAIRDSIFCGNLNATASWGFETNTQGSTVDATYYQHT